MSDRKILFITDLIDQRLRKEKDLTELIINIIQNEKIIDVRENLYDQIGLNDDSKIN